MTDPQFWLEKWERGQIGFHSNNVHAMLRRHWSRLGLDSEDSVLVPLCGKSRDMGYLRTLGHPVIGVEISPLAVNEFFAEWALIPAAGEVGGLPAFEGDGCKLIQGDFFALRAEHLPPLGGVYDRASLVAFPAERQADYARQVQSLVQPSASMLLIALEFDPKEMRGPPFSTPAKQVQLLYGDRFRAELLESADVLDENAGLRERGLTALIETAWQLSPR